MLFLCFSAIMATAIAQQKKSFSGNVKDEAGSPLQGVSVQVKGTQTFALTDATGNFTISTSNATPVLVFSGIGLGTVEMAASQAMSVS